MKAMLPTSSGSTLQLTVLLLLVFSVNVIAQDWPQFRGPQRDGKSPESGLLSEWPAEGPELSWTANGCGNGYSSVSVAGGRVYTMGDIAEDQFVIALDVQSGETLWKRRVGKANSGSYPGSRSTPTFHDGMLYCLSTEAVLYCLDANDGQVLWQHDLVQEAGARLMQAMDKFDWRFSESPLVDGDKVVVTPGAKEAAMIAYHRKTGKEIWRTVLPDLGEKGREGAGYSSAVVGQAGNVRQYVQLIGRGLIAVNADDGKFLWGYNPIANDVANISSPVTIGDQVFASTGYQTGSALLEIETPKDGQFQANEVYFLNSRVFQNHHGGFVIHDGYVYGGHGHKLGFPICIRLADGKVMWGPIRNKGKSSAAVSMADGHLYFRYQNGLMVLIEATPEGYREKSSFMIPDVRAESWAHPVIAGGRLYLKEQDKVHCYNISKTRPTSIGSPVSDGAN